MMVEYYPHRGTIESSTKEKKCFNSLNEALNCIVSLSSVFSNTPAFGIDDIYIRHHGYDSRLENECFMLCIGRYYNEDYIQKYKGPMCHGYLYFDSFKNREGASNFTRLIGALSGKGLSAQDLKAFIVDNFNIPPENIEIFGKYCRFVKQDELNTTGTLDLGKAIRTVRLIRGMTQKELGLALGFKEKTADVRIAQYEKGKRIPKSELLKKIESILNCKFNSVNYVEYIVFGEPKPGLVVGGSSFEECVEKRNAAKQNRSGGK